MRGNSYNNNALPVRLQITSMEGAYLMALANQLISNIGLTMTTIINSYAPRPHHTSWGENKVCTKSVIQLGFESGTFRILVRRSYHGATEPMAEGRKSGYSSTG